MVPLLKLQSEICRYSSDALSKVESISKKHKRQVLPIKLHPLLVGKDYLTFKSMS